MRERNNATGAAMQCSFKECDRTAMAKTLCKPHYYQQRRGEELRPLKYARRGTGHTTMHGYRMIVIPNPNGGRGRRLFEHKYVMEQVLGRPLVKGEHVHHINGVKDDNRPENLELWVTHQPAGQRPEDLVAWAQEILRRYGTCGT